MPFDLESLEAFLIRAKALTYASDGHLAAPSRKGAIDRIFQQGSFVYRDSLFDGQMAIGQEMVWFEDLPIWGENYYGQIHRPDVISPEMLDQILRRSMENMYHELRFLGAYRHEYEGYVYLDTNTGDMNQFQGLQEITKDGKQVFTMYYHGGSIT